MGQSHYFSIYLLKREETTRTALRDDHTLVTDLPADNLPSGATLLVSDPDPNDVWWQRFFGIREKLTQTFKGALVFVPAGERLFAFSFGRAYHQLRRSSYETDFGLRVTLNAVDPEKIRNTETVEPASARRQRTQVPALSDLTVFDFDRESSILKTLAGKAKEQYSELVRNVSGDQSLRVNSTAVPEDLGRLCEQLLQLYQSKDYKRTFPGIQGLARVKDPATIEQLNGQLLRGIRMQDPALLVGIPAFVDYGEVVRIRYMGAGGKFERQDASIDLYYEYLAERGRPLESITIQDLARHRLVLTDEDGRKRDHHSILGSLIYDTRLARDAGAYHLLEKDWYRVEGEYLAKLASDISEAFVVTGLPEYGHENERKYNQAVADGDPCTVCLDGRSIAPAGQTQVEPCDLYCVDQRSTGSDARALFIHVKRSTRSSGLSHLFSQGAGSIELLLGDDAAVRKLEAMVEEVDNACGSGGIRRAIAQGAVKVLFAIVTAKDGTNGYRNLPLFSQINLRRAIRQFKLMRIDTRVGYIPIAE